jgi:hypothetical protein
MMSLGAGRPTLAPAGHDRFNSALGFFIGPTLGGFALEVGAAVLAICLAAVALSLLPIFLLIHRKV